MPRRSSCSRAPWLRAVDGLAYSPAMNKRLIFLVVLGATLLLCVFLLWQTENTARLANGKHGFPLDDPWIHLQFARNLQQYGSFSYFRDQQVTAGSTSPLYTLLLAAGRNIVADEFRLSYVLGGSFLLLATILAFAIGRRLFPESPALAPAVAALLACQPRLVWIALSGMETNLFGALLLAVYLSYLADRRWWLGCSVGLLLWTRPEAVLMIAVLAADMFYRRYLLRPGTARSVAVPPLSSWSRYAKPLVVAAGFWLAYALLNFKLAGSVFPNTLAAKLKFYSFTHSGFADQLWAFLTDGSLKFVTPLSVVGALGVLGNMLRRRPAPLLVPFMWSVGLIAAYWWKLPHLVHYGRYLMPILPFAILLAAGGLDRLLRPAPLRRSGPEQGSVRRWLQTAVLLALIAVTVGTTWQRRAFYAETCAYIDDRQVATAHWIAAELPPTAVIATHDVGALAFYSGRRIVDMVGLVSPEMIANIGRTDKLLAFLQEQGVTHVAVLRSWYRIDNVNPLFVTDRLAPESMAVFAFDPERMHFTAQDAARIGDQARAAFAAGDLARAAVLTDRALQSDEHAARLHLLRGRVQAHRGHYAAAERAFARSLALQPDLWEARYGLADVAVRRRQPDEAIRRLETLVTDNPDYVAAYEALSKLYGGYRKDKRTAARYRRLGEEAAARQKKRSAS